VKKSKKFLRFIVLSYSEGRGGRRPAPSRQKKKKGGATRVGPQSRRNAARGGGTRILRSLAGKEGEGGRPGAGVSQEKHRSAPCASARKPRPQGSVCGTRSWKKEGIFESHNEKMPGGIHDSQLGGKKRVCPWLAKKKDTTNAWQLWLRSLKGPATSLRQEKRGTARLGEAARLRPSKNRSFFPSTESGAYCGTKKRSARCIRETHSLPVSPRELTCRGKGNERACYVGSRGKRLPEAAGTP